MRPLHRPQPKIGAIRWPDSHQEAVPSFVPDTPVSPVNPLVAALPGAAASVALSLVSGTSRASGPGAG
jgi:hypothetical protein